VTPMWISIVTTVVLRIPVAYAIAYLTRSSQWPHGHPFALSVSLLASWVIGMLISAVAFRYGKTRKLIRREMEIEALRGE